MPPVRQIEYFMNDEANKNPDICFDACQNLQDLARTLPFDHGHSTI